MDINLRAISFRTAPLLAQPMEGNVSNERGMRMRAAMNARAFTKLSALAAAVGVTESAISRWCHGGPITTDHLVSLCAVLDISIDWLLLGSGPMERADGVSVESPGVSLLIDQLNPRAREDLSHFLMSLAKDLAAPVPHWTLPEDQGLERINP